VPSRPKLSPIFYWHFAARSSPPNQQLWTLYLLQWINKIHQMKHQSFDGGSTFSNRKNVHRSNNPPTIFAAKPWISSSKWPASSARTLLKLS
jgi:hypothetical protein